MKLVFLLNLFLGNLRKSMNGFVAQHYYAKSQMNLIVKCDSQ